MRVLIFTYDQWDDDKGPGLDSFRGAFEVQSIEDARRKVEDVNDGDATKFYHHPTKDVGKGDYQIVDAAKFELIERGKVKYEYLPDGNTVINSQAVPTAEY